MSVLGLFGAGSCAPNIPPSNSGSGVIALFNPGSTPPVVPSPTDLVRVGGMLQIPVDPAEADNGALKTFNNYLRGLDGFPPDSTASTTFSGALDASSIADGVAVYDATANQQLTAADATAVLDATSDGKLLEIANTKRWQIGHTYLVAVFSWQDGDGVHGVRSTDGTAVLADSAFPYLRSESPIYAKCQDSGNPACACTDLTDRTCHATVDGLVDAQAQQLEVARLGMKPLIDAVVQAKGRNRSDLVMAWTFTISQRSFATFDTSRSQVPFPSNLLLSNFGIGDPMADAKVNLPILPTDSAKVQALKTGLNSLDGFSTTASVQFPIDSALGQTGLLDIDPATLIPGRTAFLLNVTVPTKPASFTAQPVHAILDVASGATGFVGEIALTPQRPLYGDRTTYAAFLTTNVKDSMGRPIVPSPTTVLLTQSSPLITSSGASAVSVLSAAQASQLELLRQGFAPLFAQLKAAGIDPATVAAFTVYRTQGIVKPMLTLLGGQAALTSLPTAVTITKVETSLVGIGLDNVSAVVHGTLSVRRVIDLRGPFNTTRLANDAANNDVIPFLMTLPIKPKVAASGAPIVIAQHGLTRWRGDTLAISNSLAGQGLALIAIDAPYHGGRVICLSDADCATGVTCTQPPPVNSVPQAGKCAGAYLASPTATPVPGTTDVLPSTALPSRDFTNLANPLATRDNFRQQTLDLFQLVRVLKETNASGLSAQLAMNSALPALDISKIGYLGQSLGAILGTNFLALSSQVNLGVLNVGGGDLVGMFTDPNSSLSVGVADALGVVPGTPDYISLLENFHWFLDPADPINFGRYVRAPDATFTPTRTAAKVILQESGMDTVISNVFTYRLGVELGLPLDGSQHLQGIDQEGTTGAKSVSTFFATADHGALFNGTAATPVIQDQAVTYLATGLGGAAPTVK